jgi:hypothetical protein
VNPDTGLHPRPSSVSHLARYFPNSSLDMGYTPTVFPSRKGESLKDLQDRADLFIETWTSRVEREYPGVKAVVIFAHAASVIALGRAVSPNPRPSTRTDKLVDRRQIIECISRMRINVSLPSETAPVTTNRILRSGRMGSNLPRKSKLPPRRSRKRLEFQRCSLGRRRGCTCTSPSFLQSADD